METEFLYDWGEEVQVIDTAPIQYAPGHTGAVCGMSEIDGVKVYTVEAGSGESMEIPEEMLRKAD
ncbi:hypothetical protein [Roseimicrobium sp. ORNL1]|uniref:hypothetical protein n=1 Tax=Roseimicrobium sp. ORNL1 TaxID=2711231 RepID=UPI00197F5730|nr:hypothetical protein [Roseimicrobium sp. ORNL1]